MVVAYWAFAGCPDSFGQALLEQLFVAEPLTPFTRAGTVWVSVGFQQGRALFARAKAEEDEEEEEEQRRSRRARSWEARSFWVFHFPRTA